MLALQILFVLVVIGFIGLLAGIIIDNGDLVYVSAMFLLSILGLALLICLGIAVFQPK